MGSGATAQSVAYGQASGEAMAIQEHQLAMIPIMQEQTEMQLELRQKAFEQELEQTEKMNLLTVKLQPEPILVPAEATGIMGIMETKPAASKYLIYAGLAILAYLFLGKK